MYKRQDKAADDIGDLKILDEPDGEEDGTPVATGMDTSNIDWAADVSAEHKLNNTVTGLEKDLEIRSAGGAGKAAEAATCATEQESQGEKHVKNVAEAWLKLQSSPIKPVSRGQ